MADMKTFTLDEAQTLLPILKSLLRRCMDGKQVVELAEKEFQDLTHKIILSGGILVNIPDIARRRPEIDKAAQDTKATTTKSDAICLQGKNPYIGVLEITC